MHELHACVTSCDTPVQFELCGKKLTCAHMVLTPPVPGGTHRTRLLKEPATSFSVHCPLFTSLLWQFWLHSVSEHCTMTVVFSVTGFDTVRLASLLQWMLV